jgi:hypothetical protein
MPNKYSEKKGWKVPKQKYKIVNWTKYNNALRQRGNVDVWLSSDSVDYWFEPDRMNDGTGSPKIYSDLAIIICHEIRSVFKLPLRQCQGFIDSFFFGKKAFSKLPRL